MGNVDVGVEIAEDILQQLCSSGRWGSAEQAGDARWEFRQGALVNRGRPVCRCAPVVDRHVLRVAALGDTVVAVLG